MLISRVPEEESGMGEGRQVARVQEDNSHDYQTANELFELMAKNQNFRPSDDESLTPRDLILLYKNIDVGTKLMSNANEFKFIKPNQYVETVIYKEDPDSDSDLSEIYSNEDIHNVVSINKERIDLFTNTTLSLENMLCHKLGDLEIQSSDTDYDKKFLFKDPYIKEQLKNFNLMTNSNDFETSALPASLLDYICCKRLEDNYNFYMDNIIRYVQHTIEQLKRISNGDYLTERAKEKWREVKNSNDKCEKNISKVLATSTSIPLHVERKITGHATKWDDIVHSEVDVRYLSKILEKKIVIEIPKLISGSFRFVSKCNADNLIISCKTEKQRVIKKVVDRESRVDVMLQLKRSKSGLVMSNISSIMILGNKEPKEICSKDVLPLTFKEEEKKCTESDSEKKSIMIIELDYNECNKKIEGNANTLRERIDDINVKPEEPESDEDKTHIKKQEAVTSDVNGYIDVISPRTIATTVVPQKRKLPESDLETNTFASSESTSSRENGNQASNESSTGMDLFQKKRKHRREASFDLIPPDELRIAMQRLNMQSSLPEENLDDAATNTTNKKKSPTRNRIKSPYENKSLIIEEMKRKKLLEIKQRRENKKMAMSENSRVVKAKNICKAAITPQPSSSVTKLSISNKSFYNSIYGQTVNTNIDKPSKSKLRKDKKETVLDISTDCCEADNDSLPSLVLNNQKYVNRIYYLDETLTEMTYMRTKHEDNAEGKETFSASTSAASNEFAANLKMFSQLIAPSKSENDSINTGEILQRFSDTKQNIDTNDCQEKDRPYSRSVLTTAPTNTPRFPSPKNDTKKSSTSIKFRESIDKIYDLMKQLGSAEQDTENETKLVKDEDPVVAAEKSPGGRESSSVPCSDSGTSVKHNPMSSDPSCFSFGKVINSELPNQAPKKTPTAKVIFNTKSQTSKTEGGKTNKDRKKNVPYLKDNSDNPLKAISQLLHEMDNVQKVRHKTPTDHKPVKKQEAIFTDGKSSIRQIASRKQPRLEQQLKDNEPQVDRWSRERKTKPGHVVEPPKSPHLVIRVDSKQTSRFVRKEVSDLVDEFNESRGEAVRGPPKLNSRLNSLAQPKKSYVQAHIDQYQSKYGRNLASNRLQKPPMPQIPEKNPGPITWKARPRRSSGDAPAAASVAVKQPTSPATPLEKVAKKISNNLLEVIKIPLEQPSCKQGNITDTPDTIKKKMVAVESYLNNHYGRVPHKADSSPSEIFRNQNKLRAPLIPNDFELASTLSSPSGEAASAIGSKIHHIIDQMTSLTPPQALTVVVECDCSCDNNGDDISIARNLSREDLVSVYSVSQDDVPNETHTQKNAENIFQVTDERNEINTHGEVKENKDIETLKQCDFVPDLQPFKSLTELKKFEDSMIELQKLEDALCRQMSIGALQNRLRLKKLTLTPKHSMQQILVVQSGDTGSVVVESKLAQNLKFNNSSSENVSDIKSLPMLTNSQVDWEFNDFPFKITTVGYAFPELNCIQRGTYTERNSVVKTRVVRSTQSFNLSYCKYNECSEPPDPLHINEIIDVEIKPTIVQKDNCITELPESNKSKQKEESGIFTDNSKSNISDFGDHNLANKSCNNKESVAGTTSLDILVGLLSEIQKITTCQTLMTKSENDDNNDELESILNVAAAHTKATSHGNVNDIVSITSLDKLRQLESSPSIYSFYISNDSEKELNECKLTQEIIDVACYSPVYTDKGVSANLAERVFKNTFTNVSYSQLLPVTANRYTDVTNSLMGLLSQQSSQFSFSEQHSCIPNSPLVTCNKKVIELPHTPKTLVNADQPVEKELCVNCSEKLLKKKTSDNVSHINADVKVSPGNNIISNKTKYLVRTSDFDPVMKIKRDILVTVYSILVFTVFAALSFPDIFYYE